MASRHIMMHTFGSVSSASSEVLVVLRQRRTYLHCFSCLRGLGLSRMRGRRGAHWASWADCMRMVNRRHPEVAETMLDGMARGPVECFRVVRSCAQTLTDAGFEMLHWRQLAEEVEAVREDNPEPNEPTFGWQQKACRVLHEKFCQEVHLPRLTEPERALMRSQHGPLASSALTAFSTHRVTKTDPQLFRVDLRRRLGLSLPLSSRTCRCGRQLDSLGHHRTARSEAGVLGRRESPLECAAAGLSRSGSKSDNECFRAGQARVTSPPRWYREGRGCRA